MPTIYATSHFTSRRAAERYYAPYGFSPADVERKLRDREIHIGPPPLKNDERLTRSLDGLRWEIIVGHKF